jgi:tellurite resistance protein
MTVSCSTHLPKETLMRSYSRNSPEAAARIVTLILISDGHVSRSEYEALNRLDGTRDLGLAPQDMPRIVQALCEDLLMEGFDGRSILSHIDEGFMVSLMAEVDEPQLQSKVLRVAASVANADKHLSDGEAAMLDAISQHWQTRPAMVASTASAAVLQRS